MHILQCQQFIAECFIIGEQPGTDMFWTVIRDADNIKPGGTKGTTDTVAGAFAQCRDDDYRCDPDNNAQKGQQCPGFVPFEICKGIIKIFKHGVYPVLFLELQVRKNKYLPAQCSLFVSMVFRRMLRLYADLHLQLYLFVQKEYCCRTSFFCLFFVNGVCSWLSACFYPVPYHFFGGGGAGSAEAAPAAPVSVTENLPVTAPV